MRPNYWVPPLLWMAVIFWMSTDSFSAEVTGSVLLPWLQYLLPWASPAQLEWLHAALRKLTHFTNYAVLALLWYRAFVRGVRLPGRRAATLALGVAVAWAGFDEGHQTMVASRTGSLVDVAIDSTGAAIALVCALVRGTPRLRAAT